MDTLLKYQHWQLARLWLNGKYWWQVRELI
jgi:hypothetical protein